MTGPPNRADRRRAWPKRRAWLDRIGTDIRLTSGCKAWLLLLARRSDDAGKPVWGRQMRMAAELGRSDRSVRYYSVEAEQLGYLTVYRSRPQRGPGGRWGRRKTNRYYLTLPTRETAASPAPRRRQRAAYCAVPATHGSRSDLPETDDLFNPLRVSPTASHHPPVDEPLSAMDSATAKNEFDRLRRALHRGNRPSR
jgi:hypothetical protein